MSLDTPTTQEISDNIIAQLESTLNQTIPLLPKAFTRVLAKALAGVFILLWKYAGWITLQQFVRTASLQPTTINGQTIRPLVEWGVLAGVGEPEPAVRAELLIEVTVEEQTGSLSQGSQLVNSDTGVTYITLSSIALDAATKQVTVRAVSDPQGNGGRGVIGNMAAGQTLDFANPLPNVDREATVVSQEVTGADQESENAYRQRIIERFRRRPQGGALVDWADWAVEPVGIINAYVYTGELGEVDVYVEATEASSGSADGIPTAAQLSAVEGSINFDEDGLATRRPANAFPNVLPISRTAFDVIVTNLSVDNPGDVQQEIEDASSEYLRDREPFILGLSVLPRKDTISFSALAGIVSEIVDEAGGTFDSLKIEENGSEVTTRTLGEGEKAKLGSITFV